MPSDQMTTAADYRKLAEECFCLATRSFPEPVRAAYIDLARLSLDTASRANDANTEHGELRVISTPHRGRRSLNVRRVPVGLEWKWRCPFYHRKRT
jgi:hypothetical protein